MKNRLRQQMFLKLVKGAVNLTTEEIFKLDPTAGAPAGYTAALHLTPKGVNIAKQILNEHQPYGYKYYFDDTKDGQTYHFVAKVEPHSNSIKGISIYERKPGSTEPIPEMQAQIESSDKKIAPSVSTDSSISLSGKIEPIKGKFKEQFASLSGIDRDNFVVDYVARYVNEIPLKKLTIKDPTDPTKFINVEVQPQHFSIEGIPVQIGAPAAERISKIMSQKTGKSHSLLTKPVIDALYAGNAYILPFQWKPGRLGDDSKKLLDYSQQEAEKLSKIDPNTFVVGSFKELMLPSFNKDKLHASGLVGSNQEIITLPNGEKISILDLINKYHTDPAYKQYEDIVMANANKIKKIQDFSGGQTGHESGYTDYSQVPRYMGDVYLSDGRTMSSKDLMEKAKFDPSLKPYVNILTQGQNYTSYLDNQGNDFTSIAEQRRDQIFKRARLFNKINKT